LGDKQYLQVVAVTAAAVTLVYALLFLFQLGAPVPAEYWVREVKIAKQYLAHRINAPKVVILGGSNALFGFNSALIERETGVKTVNMSLHAALELDYLVQFARPALKKGDTVILALEYTFYFEKKRKQTCFNSWYTNNLMAWDTQFLMEMPVTGKICLVLSASPKRIMNGALAQLVSEGLLERHTSRRLLPNNEVIKKMEYAREWARQGNPAPAYGLARMNEYGDFKGEDRSTYFEDRHYGFKSARQVAGRSRNWKAIRNFADYCRSRGIRLVVAWPPTIDDPQTGVKSPRARSAISQIRRALQELGIPVLGDPEDFSFGREYFLDTKYHLNATGGTLRTEKLVPLLKPVLAKPVIFSSTN
jgi:hypothetical protein